MSSRRVAASRFIQFRCEPFAYTAKEHEQHHQN
jgi:hypothetical protein